MIINSLSSNGEKLLMEILNHRLADGSCDSEYWSNRFESLSASEDALIRSTFKELKDAEMISTFWADNVPYIITVLNNGENYFSSGEKKDMTGQYEQIALDPDSECLLKAILDCYDGNESRIVVGSLSDLPVQYRASARLWFQRLVEAGVIVTPQFYISGRWEASITELGLRYFSFPKMNTKIKKENSRETPKEYDVFISHANKDKISFVNDLYLAVRKLGIRVFYDSEEISWGDNWKKIILNGTEKSEFAIIVISENFFDREWTERELKEFLSRQNANGQKIILPLLHGISVEDMKKKYPQLGEIQAIDTNRYSIEEITILFAKELIKRLR